MPNSCVPVQLFRILDTVLYSDNRWSQEFTTSYNSYLPHDSALHALRPLRNKSEFVVSSGRIEGGQLEVLLNLFAQ